MKILVTGGAGFIGSNLINNLTKTGIINGTPIEKVVVIDNLFLGRKEFIQSSISCGRVDFYKQDLLNFTAALKIFKKYRFDLVFHLSANSNISYGSKHTDCDLKQGTLVTYNVLECMRLTDVKQMVFSSSSAIYGEASITPIPEDYGPLFQFLWIKPNLRHITKPTSFTPGILDDCGSFNHCFNNHFSNFIHGRCSGTA